MTNSHQAGSTPADVMVTTNRVEVVDGTVPAPAPADPGPGEPHGGGEGGGTKPPVILFLPGLSTLGHNTTVRLADVMCANLTRGPGTFAVRSLDTSAGALSDGRRIVEADEASVLDLYTVQFRQALPKPAVEVQRPGVLAQLRLMVTQTLYFLRALWLLLKAIRRPAKTPVAKWQLLIGVAAVLSLFASILVTVVAILTVFGVIEAPRLSEDLVDVLALGSTAATTWLITKAAPMVRKAAAMVQQLLDYAEHDQNTATVTNCLGDALDAVLEDDPGREVYVLGYSLGALVAVDYLSPRRSQLGSLDDRHARAIKGLVTIGCPIDFIRLYFPAYMLGRDTRVTDLPWVNIYIAADVLGSNMGDDGDVEQPTGQSVVSVGDLRPAMSYRYTNEKLGFLNIWGQRGFLSHGEYWSVPGSGNCLELVTGIALGTVSVP